jgi:hypothetical protein
LKSYIFSQFDNDDTIHELQTYSLPVGQLNDFELNYDVEVARVIVSCNQRHETGWGMSGLCNFLNGKTVTRHGEDLGLTWLGDGTISMEQSLIDGAGNECFEGINHNDLKKDYFVCRSVVKYLLNPELQCPNNCPPIGSGFE